MAAIELFQLHYAVTLADCRNFSRAAEKLFISQPTLSQQIRKLEAECGFSLFRRNSKYVKLSREGELFIEKARTVLDHFESLQNMVSDLNKQLSSVISLGVNLASVAFNIGECIEKLTSKFPETKFNIIEARSAELIEMALDGKVDIAFADLRSPDDCAGLNVYPILNDYICLVVNKTHPLAGRKSVSLEELENETLICSSHRSVISRLVLRSLEEKGVRPYRSIELNSPDTRASFVSNGTGVTFVPSIRTERFHSYMLESIPIEPRINVIFALISVESADAGSHVRIIRSTLEKELRKNIEKLPSSYGMI